MADFRMPWEKTEEPEPAKVTPITGGEPTEEEMFEAFDRMFEEEWRYQKK